MASESSAVGIDSGATLTKLAIRGSGETHFELLPAASVAAVAKRVAELNPSSIGLTGGGASVLESTLRVPCVTVTEFEAWARGATWLLGNQVEPAERYLLVSLGTGTSAVLIDPAGPRRVGGTALGGGTVVGLSASLIGCRDFDVLCRLANAGVRENVDLLVSDIYRDGNLPLPGAATAAAFGKLSLSDTRRAEFPVASREDLAAAVMHLVGENVALLCSAIAGFFEVTRIVFGGSTLRGNPALAGVLIGMSTAVGRKPTILTDGEFSGALGALELGTDS